MIWLATFTEKSTEINFIINYIKILLILLTAIYKPTNDINFATFDTVVKTIMHRHRFQIEN